MNSEEAPVFLSNCELVQQALCLLALVARF